MNDEVTMVRENLDNIPHFVLPLGFAIRWYEPGDDKTWTEIQSRADKYNDITQDLFGKAFGFDEQQLRDRQCYVVDQNGIAVGTATAWYDDYHGTNFGRIHWVAIVPESQGLGLAKPMMSAVCERLLALGHSQAYLTTSTARIPAINLYLKFGFVPKVTDPRERQAWQEIRAQLKYPFNLQA